MTKILKAAGAMVLTILLAALAVSSFSQIVETQTSLNATSLSAAVTNGGSIVTVASGASISNNDLLVIDNEVMRVRSGGGTSSLTVMRGQEGSFATAHARNAKVFSGTSSRFYASAPSGSCTASSELYAPRIISPGSGRPRVEVYDCSTGYWTRRLNGNDAQVGGSFRQMDQPTFSGQLFVRESFDQGFIVAENDATGLLIKSVTDTDDNIVFGSPMGIISYREEQTKTASSWVVADGTLDISADDTTDNEGVEIVFMADGAATDTGVIVAGTSGACVTASILVTDISGTDQVTIGWRQNEAWQDAALYTGYNDWSLIGINATDGSIVALSEVAGGGTLTDDSTVNWADGETRILRSCISAAGVPSASYSADGGNESAMIPITITNGATAHTAGDQLVPFFSYLAAGTDGADVVINWVEVSAAP